MNRFFLFLFVIVLLLSLYDFSSSEEFPYPQTWWLCPHVNCSAHLFSLFKKIPPRACAFFSLSDPQLMEYFRNHPLPLVLDKRSAAILPSAMIVNESRLMHNKYCVLDHQTILTGSFNPTEANDNKNIIVVIKNAHLSSSYAKAFAKLLHQKDTVFLPFSSFACFSPWQNCRDFLFYWLSTAKKEIVAFLFSFTDHALATLLLQKHHQGIHVRVFLEKTMAFHSGSVYPYLEQNNLSVLLDHCSCFFHLKVFVIDQKYVLVGSLNPGFHGYHNYENLVIVESPSLAQELLDFGNDSFS